MSFIFKQRSQKKEILDDLNLEGVDLIHNLKDIEKSNKLLGGYSIVKQGTKYHLLNQNFNKVLHIADIGCGGGDTLRYLARWGREKGMNLKFTGIDANPNILDFAKSQSGDFEEIEFLNIDVLSKEFTNQSFDLVTFNLFMHHFRSEDIINILNLCKQSGYAVVINDLHRSGRAWVLFKLFASILGFNKISKHDGALSILRGFSAKEWRFILDESDFEHYNIQWKWAFRHLVQAY